MRNPLVWPHTSRATATVRGTPPEARELCKRALHAVLGCQGTDAKRDGSRLDVVCQFGTYGGGFPAWIRFEFEGDGPTDIAISLPIARPELSRKAQEQRDSAARDLAAWLHQHG